MHGACIIILLLTLAKICIIMFFASCAKNNCTWKNMPIHPHVLIQDSMDRLDKSRFENYSMEGYPTPVLITIPSSACNAVLCSKTCQC